MNYKAKTVLFISSAAIILCSFSFKNANNPASRKDAMVAAWERAKAYTKEYLDAAPEEMYSFKPMPEMRSFGEQMIHLATDNYKITNAAVIGITTPTNFRDLDKESFKTKAAITQVVMDCYDFVIATVKSLDESKLENTVKMFNRWETTVEDGLNKSFEHQTHHRGQTTVYLRLKGITPPAEKLF